MGIYTSNHSDMLSFTKSMESAYSAAYLSHEALNLLKLIFFVTQMKVFFCNACSLMVKRTAHNGQVKGLNPF